MLSKITPQYHMGACVLHDLLVQIVERKSKANITGTLDIDVLLLSKFTDQNIWTKWFFFQKSEFPTICVKSNFRLLAKEATTLVARQVHGRVRLLAGQQEQEEEEEEEEEEGKWKARKI